MWLMVKKKHLHHEVSSQNTMADSYKTQIFKFRANWVKHMQSTVLGRMFLDLHGDALSIRVCTYGGIGPRGPQYYLHTSSFQAGFDAEGRLLVVDLDLYSNGGNTLDLSESVSVLKKQLFCLNCMK